MRSGFQMTWKTNEFQTVTIDGLSWAVVTCASVREHRITVKVWSFYATFLTKWQLLRAHKYVEAVVLKALKNVHNMAQQLLRFAIENDIFLNS